MRLISKSFISSLSILVMLSSATYAQPQSPKVIQSMTYLSKKFEVGPGEVANKQMFNIEFPKGHVGITSFDVDLVNEHGNFVPLHETYIHHWFILKYIIKKNMSVSQDPNDHTKPSGDLIYKRNDGTCNNGILPHQWSSGSETRGTSTKLPYPYAVEIGNHADITEGWEEQWLLGVLVIDTRGAENKKICVQCRCDQFNLPENFYDVTIGFHGKFTPEYKAGVLCCQDKFQCKMRKGFQAPRRNLAIRYNITWVNWDQYQIPVRFYVPDVTDPVRTNGSETIHDCQLKFTISKKNSTNLFHVQKASIPMKKGGYLIYASGHAHRGVINAILYGQDGRNLCTSTPTYGTGKESGNEKGYLVGMSVCYPKPGSIKIDDGETVTVESIYKNEFLPAVMGDMHFYLADELSHET
ncbi:stress up-regulated Nod 19 protein [Medicago truncatula]|uniref:Stress up-regulated Nod 19 protein n=2 Tax=Medicago truncatula TaxID=3880 RepID=G7KQG9_MEDTR|nr:stress up-regulated Nod 19 protein [Medicago truncatula]